VRVAGDAEWKRALPLLALRNGDQLEATGAAAAVLLFSGVQGTTTVSAANSPYVVRPLAPAPSNTRSAELIAGLSRLLAGKRKELTFASLSTRSVSERPDVLLAPRAGKLLGPPTFEWEGPDSLRYTVRVLGPQGLVWEASGLHRAPVRYPASAPPLVPGVRYSCEILSQDSFRQAGEFTLVPKSDAAVVHDGLTAVGRQRYPRGTAALMRAALFFEHELYAEALQELRGAAAAEHGEPALHVMLGQLYERLGLPQLSDEEFQEAASLMGARP